MEVRSADGAVRSHSWMTARSTPPHGGGDELDAEIVDVRAEAFRDRLGQCFFGRRIGFEEFARQRGFGDHDLDPSCPLWIVPAAGGGAAVGVELR